MVEYKNVLHYTANDSLFISEIPRYQVVLLLSFQFFRIKGYSTHAADRISL
jgi:hypothetical protein